MSGGMSEDVTVHSDSEVFSAIEDRSSEVLACMEIISWRTMWPFHPIQCHVTLVESASHKAHP